MRDQTIKIVNEFISRIKGIPVYNRGYGFRFYKKDINFDTFEERFACYDMLNGRIWTEYRNLGEAGICLCEFIEASYWLNRKAGIGIADPAREAILNTLLHDKENKEAAKWIIKLNADKPEYKILTQLLEKKSV